MTVLFLTDMEITEITGLTGIMLALISGVWWVRRKALAEAKLALAQARKADSETHLAEAGILDKLDGLAMQISAVGDRIEKVEHEMKPNSGKSFHDAVDRVARTQDVLIDSVKSLGHQIGHLNQNLDDERVERRSQMEQNMALSVRVHDQLFAQIEELKK